MTVMEEIEKYDFTKGSISTLLSLCCKVTTEEEAKRLLERYRAIEKFADQNLGYIFGYCGEETRARLYKLFPVNHPIFGSGFGRGIAPSPDEAITAGTKMAKGTYKTLEQQIRELWRSRGLEVTEERFRAIGKNKFEWVIIANKL